MRYNQIIKELCEISDKEVDLNKLNDLNEYLKQLFRLYKDESNYPRAESIYKELVGYGCKANDWNAEKNSELEEKCKKLCDRKIWFNSNYNWSQVHLDGRNIFSYIKVYVSLEQSDVADIFIQTIEELLKVKSASFAAKISNQGRHETFVFWVEKKDFLILQELLKPYRKQKPLKLIAYYDDYGISKEFSSSQNDAMSELIAEHFKKTDYIEDVNVARLFEIALQKTDRKKYNFIPQTLPVLFKTLFVLLGKADIKSDDFLLNDEEKLWDRSGCKKAERDYSRLKEIDFLDSASKCKVL